MIEKFPPTTWERQSFEQFRRLLLVQEPQIYPCVYATKGFKAREHLYAFCATDQLSDSKWLPVVAGILRSYAERSKTLGPMTSLVILTPCLSQSRSLLEYYHIYWNTLRGIANLDDHTWPDDVPQAMDSTAWCYCFHGQKFVSLALNPSYTSRRSRYCPCSCIAFQPVNVFQKLMPTPQKAQLAFDKVRELSQVFDEIEYSPDVIATGDGVGSAANMFFLNDNNKPSRPPFLKVRSTVED